MTSLWMMFSGAFLAATLLPGGSEVLLVALLSQRSLYVVAIIINGHVRRLP
ncbi:hypothetical protein PEC18_00680 [Paucibacter sp. O1-1]|nr:hypothetical protein [Paucibacter sp. O1-1]MDA3824422.1 hypothetical protein [Paucibacter sp. O1-1]